MKAWVHSETGTPAALELRKVPDVMPGAGDILVRNKAIGLNPVDWKFIEWGHPAWDWPHIPGVDGAGIVETIGEGVTHVKVGQRVAYHNDLVQPGSFAEATVIPARAAVPLPDELPFEIGASLPCPWLTAWQAQDKVPLRPDMNILVTGASGAVGGALLQLIRREGHMVHAVASAGQHNRVMGLGAASTSDYRDPAWQAQLKAGSFDVVFDMISGTHARQLAPLLATNGHLICIQDRQETAPLDAFTTTISLHEVGLNAMHGFGSDQQWTRLTAAGADIAKGMQDGALDSQLIETAPFSDLPEALQRLKTGPNPGNRAILV